MFGSLPGADHRCWVELLYNRSFCVFVVSILPPSRNIQWINRLASLSTIPQDVNKTASFQKEAMRTQVALYFFMKWNLYRVVSLCLNKKTSKTDKLRKVYCFKRLWSERNDWIGLHLFIPRHVLRDISSVLHADRSLHGAWNSLL